MRIAIIGNAGSGKSTLADQLSAQRQIQKLDLDTIVWEPNKIAVQRDPGLVSADLHDFCSSHDSWIVEGCYAGLIEVTLEFEPELVFLNPGLEQYLSNCRARPWESHKYASQEAQDSKLEFLLEWVADYYTRDGDMSFRNHEELFKCYGGSKRMLTKSLACRHTMMPSESIRQRHSYLLVPSFSEAK